MVSNPVSVASATPEPNPDTHPNAETQTTTVTNPPDISITDVRQLEGTNPNPGPDLETRLHGCASSVPGTAGTANPVPLPSTKTITLTEATADGTATAPSDYTAIPPTTLTFAPDATTHLTATTQPITVQVVADNMFEAIEKFHVLLTAATNANVVKGDGVGTILNDDAMFITGPGDNLATTVQPQQSGPRRSASGADREGIQRCRRQATPLDPGVRPAVSRRDQGGGRRRQR